MNGEAIQLSEDGAVRPGDRRPAGFGFVETLQTLKRRRWTIIATTLLGVALAYLAVVNLTPQYVAKATVMLDPRQANVVDVEDVLSGLPAGDDTVNSEILVIRSPLLVSHAVRTAGLANAKEFMPQPESSDGLLGWLSSTEDDTLAANVETAEARLHAQHAEILANVLERLNVARAGRSRAIDLRFTSEDPEAAARLVNALADAYLADQLQAKQQATASAQEFLDSRVAELRAQVQTAERAIEAYRIDAGLVGTGAGTIAAQQLSGLNTQLVLASAKRAEAEARLGQARRLAGAGGAESAAEVLQSQLIVNLRDAETEAERRIAELAEEYGERHPQMISARTQLRDVQRRIASEVAKIIASLQNEVAVARARESALEANVAGLERTAADQGAAEVQIRALEREADAARALFAQFLARASETATQRDIQRPDARILARATAPTTPNFPKPATILPIAAMLAFALGIVLALLLEQLERGYRSSEQIERALGLRPLGLVPAVSRRTRRGAPPEAYVLDKPSSAYAEALRSIVTSLRFGGADGAAPRSVMVTSALPKEGKSTLALSLGRMLASGGRSVLLIDADFRRPRVAEALGLETGPGLAGVLGGGAHPDAAMRRDDASGLHVLPAGAMTATSAADMLGSEAMAQLLRAVEQQYDLVLIDAPPALAVADSRVLASQVDAVLFAVKWAKTRRRTVNVAVSRLQDAGARIVGAALLAVDVRKHAQYGFGDSDVYFAARGYYQD